MNPVFWSIETNPFIAWGDLPLAALFGLVALLICSAGGFVLHRLAGRRGLPPVCFEHALSGLAMLVSCFAIIHAKGLTVLLPVPLLVLGSIRFRSVNADAVKGEWLAGILGILGFLLFYAGAFDSDAAYLRYPSGDLAYYARLADHLLLSGQENRLVDLPVPADAVAQPYHWGDTWSLAMLTRRFNIRAIYALPLVLFPLLTSVLCMGLYRLLRSGSGMPMFAALLICLLLPFTPPVAALPGNWTATFNLLPAPVAQYPKLLIYAIFFTALLHRLRDGDMRAAAWMLASGGLFHLSMLPVAGAGLVVIMIASWRNDPRYHRLLLECGTLLAALLIWPALLYGVLSASPPFYSTGGAAQRFRLHPGILLPILANLAMLWPYALLLLVVRRFAGPFRVDAVRMLRGIVLLLIAGAAGWIFTVDRTTDGVQFFTATIPLAATGLLLLCLTSLPPARRYWLMALCVLLPAIGLLVNRRFGLHTFQTDRISQSDYRLLQTIPAISRPYDSLKAVVIKSPSDLDRIGTRSSVVFYPLEFLAFDHPQYQASSLQVPFMADVPRGNANAGESARMKWHTPLMQFVRTQSLSAVPPELQVYWYVKTTRPDILIIANDAEVPGMLRPFLGDDSIRLQSKPYRVLPLYYGR